MSKIKDCVLGGGVFCLPWRCRSRTFANDDIGCVRTKKVWSLMVYLAHYEGEYPWSKDNFFGTKYAQWFVTFFNYFILSKYGILCFGQ